VRAPSASDHGIRIGIRIVEGERQWNSVAWIACGRIDCGLDEWHRADVRQRRRHRRKPSGRPLAVTYPPHLHSAPTGVPQMILTLGTRNRGWSWENRGAHGEAACV
jgi:hypothetical protein